MCASSRRLPGKVSGSGDCGVDAVLVGELGEVAASSPNALHTTRAAVSAKLSVKGRAAMSAARKARRERRALDDISAGEMHMDAAAGRYSGRTPSPEGRARHVGAAMREGAEVE